MTPPLLVSAAVLVVAGLSKLRNPAPALAVLGILRLPARPGLVRALASGELALGGWCAAGLGTLGALILAGLFAGFAILALRLAGAGVSCGCFGVDRAPVSLVQVGLSAGLAAVTLVAALSGAHGVGWMAQRSLGSAMLTAFGTAGAVYAVVLGYKLVPQAWSAWSVE